MATNGNYLTLIDLSISYGLFVGIGHIIAGATGMWVGAAVITALWLSAIFRAAYHIRVDKPENDDDRIPPT